MAVDRRTSEGLAADAVGIYSEAERRLLLLIARKLRAGKDEPDWARRKLDELQELRRRAQRVIAQAQLEGNAAVAKAVERAWLAGAAAADDDLAEVRMVPSIEARASERRVQQLASAATSSLDSLANPTVQTLLGTYQQVIVTATAGSVTGAATRLDDAQAALNELARRGIGTLMDARGRRWELASYVEMATRTTTARAAVAGTLDRLADAGLDLVMVSDSPRECELCRPWEGKILARSGGAGRRHVESATTGQVVAVDVAATVDAALRDGLMHPNCTHNLSAYVPGATKIPTNTANPQGAQERAQLRGMERKVREWKRREAVALTPDAEARARAKVRDWQARIRSHVDDTGLPRKRNREQIGRTRAR